MKLIPALALFAGAFFALPSIAATVTFNTEVVGLPSVRQIESAIGDTSVLALLPPIGTTGTITVEVDDALFETPLPETGLGLPSGSIVSDLEIPGFLTAGTFVEEEFGIRVSDDDLFIVSTSDTRLVGYPFGSDGLNSIDLFFGDGAGPVETYGDLFDAIAGPGTTGLFEADFGGFVESVIIEVAILPGTIAPAPVPLPASAFLLMGGLGGLGLIRRRARRIKAPV